MRKWHKAVLAALFVLTAGIAVWLVSSDAPTRVNAPEFPQLTPSQATLAPLRADLRTEQPASESAAPTHDPVAEHAGDDASVDSWLLRGSFVLPDDLPFDPLLIYPDLELWIGAPSDDDEPGLIASASVDGDYTFETDVAPQELMGATHNGPPPQGEWRIGRAKVEFTSGRTLDEEGREEMWVKPNLLPQELMQRVQPSIEQSDDGFIIDFGKIALGWDELPFRAWIAIGRLVHTTGTPISFSDSAELCFEDSDGKHLDDYGLTTDADGRFVQVFDWDFDEDEVAFNPMTAIAKLKDDSAESQPNELRSPIVRGIVLDYGEIRLPGALVEVELRFEGVEPDAKPSLLTDTSRPHVNIDFNSGLHRRDVTVMPAPMISRFVVPEGRYLYQAKARKTTFDYEESTGVVVAPDGVTTRCVIELKLCATIVIDVQTSDGLTPARCEVFWQEVWRGADPTNWHGPRTVSPGEVRVPLIEGWRMLVKIVAKGYREHRVTVGAEDDGLKIVLKPLASGVLVVHTPPAPPDKQLHELDATLNVAFSEDFKKFHHTERVYRAATRTLELALPGAYLVWISGGHEYGYPGGILSDVARCNVGAGEHVEVTLSAIPPPPWGAETHEKMLVRPTCGGQPVGYQGSVVTQGIGRNVDWTHGSQTESLAGAHIVDGPGKQVEVQVKIPEGGKLPVAEFDLEARVVVHIVRGGVSQPGFDVRIGSRDGTVVRATTTPKGANLWCPPGHAEIEVLVGYTTFAHRSLKVVPGELQVVEFALSEVQVEFIVNEDGSREAASDIGWLPPAWLVRDMDGQTADIRLQQTSVQLLKPGRYRLLSCYGEPAHDIELDLRDGVDRVIELPTLTGYTTAELRLQFDKSILAKTANIDVDYALARALKEFQNPDLPLWAECHTTIEGALVSGLPVGQEVVIQVHLQSPDDNWYISRPLVVTLPHEGMTLKVTIEAVVHLDYYDWSGFEVYQAINDGRLIVPLFYDTLTPGRHELVVARKGQIVHRGTLDVPAPNEDESMVPMPADWRTKLIELGLIEPEEEDED